MRAVLLWGLLLTPLCAAASPWGALSRAGKVSRLGKAGKLAAAAKATGAVTAAVAAERGGLLLAGLGDDAARSAAFLARTGEGELALVTRGGQSTVQRGQLFGAVDELRAHGPPAVYLDATAAADEAALRALPEDTLLYLVDDGVKLPVRSQSTGGGARRFVVETADGAVDLAGLFHDDRDDDELPAGILAAVAVALYLWWRWRRSAAAA